MDRSRTHGPLPPGGSRCPLPSHAGIARGRDAGRASGTVRPAATMLALTAWLAPVALGGCSATSSGTGAQSSAAGSAATRTSAGTTDAGSSGSAATTGANSTGTDTDSGTDPGSDDSTGDGDGTAGPAAATTAAATTNAAACSTLSAARVEQVTGIPVDAGSADLRAATAGRVQLDGCSYAGADGQIGYLVWRLATTGDRAVVREGLAPAGSGVTRFVPDLAGVAAGALVDTGPTTSAQINAARGERLVQVGVSASSAAAARTAATDLAAALLRR